MGTPDPWSDTGAEMPEDETRYCEAIAVPERRYLSNGDPGYPAEGCDEEALEGSDYCAKHQHEEEPLDIDYGDPDMEYDVLRERMGE